MFLGYMFHQQKAREAEIRQSISKKFKRQSVWPDYFVT